MSKKEMYIKERKNEQIINRLTINKVHHPSMTSRPKDRIFAASSSKANSMTKIMTRTHLLVFFLLTTAALRAAQPPVSTSQDTLTTPAARPREAFTHNFSYMGLPFILAGIVVKEQNTHFRTLRNRFEPAFHKRYDDYTQYVPLAATWGLKAAGVQGRSSWGELAVSNAFSAVLMAGMVNGLKYTVREWRPDHSTRNSFPSGHTATAFLCATILHKEYGMKSPWYSIGGYTLAGLTGVTRQLNNRHWIGDVLVGAGIGILSADLGYFLSDLIFKPQAAARKKESDYSRTDAPSFLSFNMGMATGPAHLQTPELYDSKDGTPLGMRLRTGTSTVVSVEGAWFVNTYIGLGGRLKVSTTPIVADIPTENLSRFDMDGDRQEGAPVNMFQLKELESDHLGLFDMDLGVYLSYPFSWHWQAGAKLLAGRRLTADFSLNSVCRINPQIFDRTLVNEATYNRYYRDDVEYYKQTEGLSAYELLQEEFVDDDFLRIRKSRAWKAGTGIWLNYRYKKDAALRLYADYDFAAPRLTYDLRNSWTDEEGRRTPQSYTRRTSMHNVTLGAAIAFVF